MMQCDRVRSIMTTVTHLCTTAVQYFVENYHIPVRLMPPLQTPKKKRTRKLAGENYFKFALACFVVYLRLKIGHVLLWRLLACCCFFSLTRTHTHTHIHTFLCLSLFCSVCFLLLSAVSCCFCFVFICLVARLFVSVFLFRSDPFQQWVERYKSCPLSRVRDSPPALSHPQHAQHAHTQQNYEYT